MITLRRGLIAAAVAVYLYFLLPATATLFYELYHLTHVEVIYWGYSGFKAAGRKPMSMPGSVTINTSGRVVLTSPNGT